MYPISCVCPSLITDHLFRDAVSIGNLDRFRLLLEAGYPVPSDLLHFAVSSSSPALIRDLIASLSPTTVQSCLEWKDATGERPIDAAYRLGQGETVDLLRRSGSASPYKEKTGEDRTSSVSLMKAIELGRRYKLEPVNTMFKEKKKKKKYYCFVTELCVYLNYSVITMEKKLVDVPLSVRPVSLVLLGIDWLSSQPSLCTPE